MKDGIYPSPLPPDLKLAQIALDDLAALVVLALENKSRFIGKRIDAASDNLSGQQQADILSEVIEKPIKYVQIPIDDIKKMSEDMAIMYEWFEKEGYNVNLSDLHHEYPEIEWMDYQSWAKKQDWDRILNV